MLSYSQLLLVKEILKHMVTDMVSDIGSNSLGAFDHTPRRSSSSLSSDIQEITSEGDADEEQPEVDPARDELVSIGEGHTIVQALEIVGHMEELQIVAPKRIHVFSF